LDRRYVSKSGLLPIKFDAPGHRALLYHSNKNLLYVESPFADKTSLSRLGGSWSKGDPKGWSWFFSLDNLEMLLDTIPFDSIDSSIEEAVKIEQERVKQLRSIRKAALKDKPISLRVPNLKTSDEVSLRNYQKLGIQFAILAKYGFLLGDEMGLGKCAAKSSKIYSNYGNLSLEDVWEKYSIEESSRIDEHGEWRNLHPIKVCGLVDHQQIHQKATSIYRERVSNISTIGLQDGSVLNVGYRHAFFTNHNVWEKAKNIKVGDWILVSKKIDAACNDSISNEIVNSSDRKIAEFLRNYFEEEGCCNKDCIEIKSKSEKTIRDIQFMLRRLGIIGVVSNKIINSNFWMLAIDGVYAKEFQNKVGFLSDRKINELKSLCQKSKSSGLGNIIPCKSLLQKLMYISGLTEQLTEEFSSVNPSVEKTKSIISLVKKSTNDNLIESHYSLIKNQIEEILSQIESMIFDDFVWMQVSSVKDVEYNDYVYDLEIDGEHNYIVDMALGHNSVQSIGIAVWRKKFSKARRCLIVSPASVKYNWKEELELWTDESFVIIDGPPDKREALWDSDAYFVVVNPELIVRDFDDVVMLQEEFDLIIVDEIHMLKNWKSKRSKFMKKLKLSGEGLKIGLSGTPIDGRLEDLHSIFEFLVPNLFMTRGKFLDKYAIRNEFNSVIGYVKVEEIKKTIEPYFLRRLKKDVAKELPEKIFTNVYVDLSTDERTIYNAIRNQAHKITEEAEAITAVLRARQFCNAPGLVDEYPEFGAKYETCMALLEEIIDNGHKVLIFSMFEQMVDKLYVQFEKRGWKCMKITGKVKKKDRPLIARQFNEDPTIDICVMDEAGSTGLNFQEASYVLHYDDNWSPAIMKQRTDRAHRLTTKHVVTVVNFICKDTIEDHVRDVLKDKDLLSASAIGDNVDEVCAIKSLGAKRAIKLL